MLMPPNDPSRAAPLDHPSRDRPHRVYVALTNHCNRACPWCSTCSSPDGNTWLSAAQFAASFPPTGFFQLQLEGGEPTVHPEFWEFVRLARENTRCTLLVLCTNGVALPRSPGRLREYLHRLGTPLIVKLSINHHLLDHDAELIELATELKQLAAESVGQIQLVLNVRLRRGYDDDDRRVRERVEQAGLLPEANIFYLQRYGFAANELDWEPPAPVWDNFRLVNPDGQVFGPDLIARSEGMRRLP
jgi:MoaA/NifB/PqqE/SkfB family radical SAM enzyme